MNIILVDDDLDDVLLFRQAINDINKALNCVELGSGMDLINYLEVTSYQPRMIFLDFNMPGMNGLECLKEIRKVRKYDAIPVIIYTTYLSQEQRSGCVSLGASILLKPSTYGELLDSLESKILEVSNIAQQIS